MKRIDVKDADRPLADYIDSPEPVIVTRGGKPVAAIVQLGDVDEETLAVALSPTFHGIVASSRQQVRQGETLSHEELWEGLE